MFLGIDASTQLEVNEKDPKYFYKGERVEPWSFLYNHNNVKSMRLRLWLDPYDENHNAYGGGTVDYEAFKKLALEAQKIGYSILLDFHYSDFWCDPGKQFVPKAWRNLTLEEIVEKVYSYTKEALIKIKKDGINLIGIQIGNEITNGMLWPYAHLDKTPSGPRKGYDNLAKVLKAGIKASKEEFKDAVTIIHLENSGNKELHEEFFTEITSRGVEFDVIGLSYYPYWHGTFEMLFNNISNLKEKFHKPIWIVETGYGFTMEPFINEGGFKEKNLIDDNFFKQENVYRPYPLSKEGQKEFIKELLRLSKINGIEAIYYWEPFWLHIKGLEWASKAGETYTNELEKPTTNEWANQCLFDYEGNATPGIDEFKID